MTAIVFLEEDPNAENEEGDKKDEVASVRNFTEFLYVNLFFQSETLGLE